MLRMVQLDWFAMKYAWVKMIAIPLTLFLMGILSSIYLVPISVFLFFCLSLNPFAVEEKSDLNRLYLTLPVKRSDIVTGRYVLSLLMFCVGILLGLGFMPLANLFSFSKWYPDFKWCLALIAFGFLLYSLLCLFMYPLLFLLGYLRGKFWGVFVPMVLFGLILSLFMLYERMPGNEKVITSMLIYAAEHIFWVSGGMFLLGGIILLLSFFLSVRLYEKESFDFPFTFCLFVVQ